MSDIDQPLCVYCGQVCEDGCWGDDPEIGTICDDCYEGLGIPTA